MSFIEFLVWAGSSAGINVVVGFILSFVVEWWPAYESLPARSKRLMMMGLCFVIPVLALLGRLALGESILTVDSIWWAVLAGFTAFFGSQAADVRNRASDRADT